MYSAFQSNSKFHILLEKKKKKSVGYAKQLENKFAFYHSKIS